MDEGAEVGVKERELARRLTGLSAEEMVDAVGLRGAPGWLRRPVGVPFRALSRPLARVLARFDREIGERGLPAAAREALGALGASLACARSAPASGALLVLANHPGAYDAFALMAAVGRADLAILAADRGFLRALPGLARHLVLVHEGPVGRVASLRRAMGHLRAGGALLHFPAGRIEPDPAFAESVAGSSFGLLAPWMAGTEALVRATASVEGAVVVAGVWGVHSPRAKRSRLNGVAERRGVTTLAPLLQLALRLRDVRAEVGLSEARSAAPCEVGEDVTATLRGVLLGLCEGGASAAARG